MQEILVLQQKIIPEMMELLEKRYKILRTIYYNQPIGRRILADSVNMGERIVRTEINFLKSQNLIEINTPGMTITEEGEEIINKLKDFIHELKGLSEIEVGIKEYFKLQDVIIVPGNIDEDKTITKELGRIAANYIKKVLKCSDIVALTGGSTIKEVVDNLPRLSNMENVLAIPARGGMGRNVETQANTLAAQFANKVGGSYKLLHIPDNLSNDALNTLINEKDIKEVIDNIHNADMLLFGIGRADDMAFRRGLSNDQLEEMLKLGAVGEAFGCYFNKNGEMVYSTPTIGVNNDMINKIPNRIAIAGGSAKAGAIVAIESNLNNSVLITDEGAAREIIHIIEKTE